MASIKKSGGFTLVELIICIAILSILMSVAVGGYAAYITKANNAAIAATLNQISNAAILANATEGPIARITAEPQGENLIITIYADSFATEASPPDYFIQNFHDIYPDMHLSATDNGTVTFYTHTPDRWFDSMYAQGAMWDGTWKPMSKES